MQLKPLEDAVEKYLGEDGIRQRIDTFREIDRESSDFRALVGYFAAIGSPAIAELLHSLEDEESRHVRLLICQALAQIGDTAIRAVAERINHPQWFVARNAVSILGQIGTPQCVSYLDKALSHEEVRVRKEALKGLASVRTDEAIDRLCACVNGDDIEACKTALGWVSVIGTERALPAVEELLDDDHIWKTDNDIVRLAIETLGNIGSEPAAALLESLTRKRRLWRRRKSALIRQTATAALQKIKGK